MLAVVGGGWVVAGWMNLPMVWRPYAPAFAAAVAVTCAVCFWAGRRQGRAGAFAAAYASAEARANAAAMAASRAQATNAVFVQVGEGARHRAAADLGGLDDAEWIAGPKALLEQEVGEMYLEELDGDADRSLEAETG